MKKLSVAVAAAFLVLAPATAASAGAPILDIDAPPVRANVGVHARILDIDASARILDID